MPTNTNKTLKARLISPQARRMRVRAYWNLIAKRNSLRNITNRSALPETPARKRSA